MHLPVLLAFAAAGSRRFLTRPDRRQLLNRTARTMMIGTGVAVVTR
jgi:threonine/homoserine/homoserine lactone efflux protein